MSQNTNPATSNDQPEDVMAKVTFMFKHNSTEALMDKAAEIDGEDAEDSYTIAQALQVVWHADPEWLHENVLAGWTLNETLLPRGDYAPVWPSPLDCTPDAIAQAMAVPARAPQDLPAGPTATLT